MGEFHTSESDPEKLSPHVTRESVASKSAQIQDFSLLERTARSLRKSGFLRFWSEEIENPSNCEKNMKNLEFQMLRLAAANMHMCSAAIC